MPKLLPSLVRVLLAIAIPVTICLGIVWSKAPFRLRSSRDLDADIGQQTFQDQCARCHTLNGLASTGPSLQNIGVEGAKRKPGMSAAAYILESVLEPDVFKAPGATGNMPRVADHLEDGTLLNLVYFLAAQGAEPDAGEILNLSLQRKERPKPPPPDREKVERGDAIFRGKGNCASCHLRGNLVGPSLEEIGLMGTDYIRESLLDPDRQVHPAYSQTTVTLKSGKLLVGRLLHQTPKQVVLLSVGADQSNYRHIIPIADIETNDDGKPEIVQSTRSLMPSYRDVLTSTELDEVVHFLSTFR